MAKIRINGDTSGYVDLTVPAIADNSTVDLVSALAAKVTGETGSTEPTGKSAGYLWGDTASKVMKVYTGSAWLSMGKILQVVSTIKTDTFSSSTAGFVDVTGLAVSITPASTTNTILVMATVSMASSGSTDVFWKILRGSTAVGVGTGGTMNVTAVQPQANANFIYTGSLSFVDSPSSTSAQTYKVQISPTGGSTAYVNRRAADAYFGTPSSITVLEIAA